MEKIKKNKLYCYGTVHANRKGLQTFTRHLNSLHLNSRQKIQNSKNVSVSKIIPIKNEEFLNIYLIKSRHFPE